MTRAEFARHRGVSKAAVTQWAAAGRLVLSGTGVNVEGSDSRLAETVNNRGGKRKAGVVGGAQADASGQPGDFRFGGTLTEARTSQARNRAKLDDLDYQERIGKLVEKSRYDAALADGMAPIMSQLDNLSTRLAPKVAGLTDVRRIQDIVDDEVARIRQDTADTLRAMISGSRATKQ